MWRRPSWTPIVWPTSSGKIVQARDQVLTTSLRAFTFMSCTLRSSFGSMYQPFLVERLILSSMPSALRLAPPHDVLLRGLVAPRLVAHGRLAPGRLRLA